LIAMPCAATTRRRWSTSLSGMRAVATRAMHETARQITVTDAAG
jgi:hypothetical protein